MNDKKNSKIEEEKVKEKPKLILVINVLLFILLFVVSCGKGNLKEEKLKETNISSTWDIVEYVNLVAMIIINVIQILMYIKRITILLSLLILIPVVIIILKFIERYNEDKSNDSFIIAIGILRIFYLGFSTIFNLSNYHSFSRYYNPIDIKILNTTNVETEKIKINKKNEIVEKRRTSHIENQVNTCPLLDAGKIILPSQKLLIIFIFTL